MLSNENYKIAVEILKERYGNKQYIIDLHYSILMNLTPPNNRTESLRHFLDTVEKHFRSLDILSKNTDQNMFVSIIKSMLPRDTLLQLEIQKGTDKEWTVKELRERLRSYITAKERAEQDKSYHKGNTAFARPVDQSKLRMAAMDSKRVYGTSSSRPAMSAQALVSTENTSRMYSDKCMYCTNRHWSDN